jgi:Mrp family chromosome partitioning ATPase
MEELVQSLRASADVVLVDCPPLLPVSDPMVAARFADGVLLTVSAGANTIDQVQAAKVMCEKAGVALVGAILNGTSVGERQQPTEYDYDYFDRAVPANGSKPPTVGTLSDGGPPPIDEEDTDVKRRGRVES